MAKKSAQALRTAPAPDTAASIDDIFASKPKTSSKPVPKSSSHSTSSNAIASSSKLTTDPPKKKKKKLNAIPAFIPDESTLASTTLLTGEGEASRKKSKKVKRDSAVDEAPKRVVEEVVDLSLPRPAAPVPVVSAASAVGMKSSKKREKRKEAGEDDDMFADSRGTGPRRKTEEGFLIYKEAELQIDPEAGGTPLCPFDCECCF